MKIRFHVWGYAKANASLGKLDARIEKEVTLFGKRLGLKFKETGSGCGFGERDISFVASVPEKKVKTLVEFLRKHMKVRDGEYSLKTKSGVRLTVAVDGGLELVAGGKDFDLEIA